MKYIITEMEDEKQEAKHHLLGFQHQLLHKLIGKPKILENIKELSMISAVFNQLAQLVKAVCISS